MISATEDQRPNVITKDPPIAVLAQEMPRVWGAVSQGPGMKPGCTLHTHQSTAVSEDGTRLLYFL